MDNHEREFYIREGRHHIKSAFHYDFIPGQSIAYFPGKSKPEKKQSIITRLRLGRVASVVHAVETRPSGRSKPNLLVTQEINGQVHRCMAELDGLHYQWVQFRYRPAGVAKDDHRRSFHMKYFQQYTRDHLRSCKTGTRRVVRTMIALAMIDRSNPGLALRAMPEGSGVSPRNWNKTYMPHWKRIASDLSRIDSEALCTVGQKLNS